MDVLFGLGVLLAVAAIAVTAWFVWRLRQDAHRRRRPLDLDLNAMPAEPRRRRDFADDTAPAVLSVPPELDHPEWDPNWEPPGQKRPNGQRWLH